MCRSISFDIYLLFLIIFWSINYLAATRVFGFGRFKGITKPIIFLYGILALLITWITFFNAITWEDNCELWKDFFENIIP